MLGRIGRYLTGIDVDKYIHFIVCELIAFAAASMIVRIIPVVFSVAVAFAFAVICGAVKELADMRSRDNSFSWTDMLADALGALTGALMWYWAALVFY